MSVYCFPVLEINCRFCPLQEELTVSLQGAPGPTGETGEAGPDGEQVIIIPWIGKKLRNNKLVVNWICFETGPF